MNTSARRTTFLTLVSLAMFLCAGLTATVSAQQRDGEETTNTATPSGRVNFNIIQLMNGEYLEMFGTGTSRGILRGHPTFPAVELGTTSADPLIFSTSGVERMRIGANGFIGFGTLNPAAPFELFAPAATSYAANNTNAARIRLINTDTAATANNLFEIDLGSYDSAGVVSSVVRLAGITTNHTTNATAGDFAIGLRNAGTFFESTRFASNGNVGIGTQTPAYKLDVAGPVRSTSGGFIFPDGTVQTTANAGAGGATQWLTSGANIYYNGGNVGLGTSTPGVALDVAQTRAIRVGFAYLSSGSNDYANFANHGWYNGTNWVGDGVAGAIYNLNGAQHTWYTHNTAGVVTPLMNLGADGSLGIGTQTPSSRLHVNGGSIRLNATAGETPFQLYSYSNSSSLWLTSGNPNVSEIHLSPAYAVDYDRSVAMQYTPGTTGGAAGVLRIGQMSKNNANWTHGATAFFTSGLERLRIDSAGNVGINVASPTAKLQVSGVAPSGTAVFTGSVISSHFNYNGDGSEDTYIRGGKSTSRVILNDANSGNVLMLGSGKVGIGTGSPAFKLDVAGQIRSSTGGFVFPDGSVQTTASTGGVSSQWTTFGANIYYAGGNVGIGTTGPTEKLEVVGNIKVSGNINAKYQDVAEWVESSQELDGGTVVILDSSKANNVIASTQSYDSRVAGVISLQPGLTLGEEGEGRVLVATTGRVKVKVDATNGPIQIGDLLVTSDRAGVAMKSQPVDIGGVRIHRPGTLIGKALEPLEKGSGSILVLLSLQ